MQKGKKMTWIPDQRVFKASSVPHGFKQGSWISCVLGSPSQNIQVLSVANRQNSIASPCSRHSTVPLAASGNQWGFPVKPQLLAWLTAGLFCQPSLRGGTRNMEALVTLSGGYHVLDDPQKPSATAQFQHVLCPKFSKAKSH